MASLGREINRETTQELESHVLEVLSRHQLTHASLIVGLSGGPDSVALLSILHTLRESTASESVSFTLSAAHINHGWRIESDAEEQFCRELCDRLSVPFYSAHLRDLETRLAPHKQKNRSAEARARACRQLFFADVMREHAGTAVALGHHRDDQLETFFVRLIRGAGIDGLASMREYTPPLIRPLLNISKNTLLAYLSKKKLSYCLDNSNSSNAYLRNRIRSNLIPALSVCDERGPEKALDTIEQLQECASELVAIRREIRAALERHSPDSRCVEYDLTAYRKLRPFMQRGVILDILILHAVPVTPSASFLAGLVAFLLHDRGGSHEIYVGYNIRKKGTRFALERT